MILPKQILSYASKKWLPMELAPKDGQLILARGADPWGVFVIRWGLEIYAEEDDWVGACHDPFDNIYPDEGYREWIPVPRLPWDEASSGEAWSPMSSAPRNGAAILLLSVSFHKQPFFEVEVARWHSGFCDGEWHEGWWSSGQGMGDFGIYRDNFIGWVICPDVPQFEGCNTPPQHEGAA